MLSSPITLDTEVSSSTVEVARQSPETIGPHLRWGPWKYSPWHGPACFGVDTGPCYDVAASDETEAAVKSETMIEVARQSRETVDPNLEYEVLNEPECNGDEDVCGDIAARDETEAAAKSTMMIETTEDIPDDRDANCWGDHPDVKKCVCAWGGCAE